MSGLISSELQHKRMLETPIPRLIITMAIPTVTATLITVIYNTADTYFVSQINKSASAAVGVVFAIMSVIQAFGYGLGMGAGSITSRKLGEKKNQDADRYTSSAFFASLLAGAVVGWSGLCFLKPILKFLGCSSTMMPYASVYARYILIAAPITCATFVLNNTLRSCGQANLAMWGTVTGGLLNIVLDPIFIFVFDLGTGGAAMATALSQCTSFLILAYDFIRKKAIVTISLKNISTHLIDYQKIITTGAPTIFRQGLGSVATAALNIQAVIYGDAAVSAITIANKVYLLIRNAIMGIGQGFQPVAGYNYGAGNKQRTKHAFIFACILGSIICSLSAIIVLTFTEPIMQWFSNDAEVMIIGKKALQLACAVMPFLAFSTFVNQLYQCLGFKLPATLLASCRQGIFFLPIIFLLPMKFNLLGIQIAQPLADFLTFVISIPFLIFFFKKHLHEN